MSKFSPGSRGSFGANRAWGLLRRTNAGDRPAGPLGDTRAVHDDIPRQAAGLTELVGAAPNPLPPHGGHPDASPSEST
jgi:hypothetical protein